MMKPLEPPFCGIGFYDPVVPTRTLLRAIVDHLIGAGTRFDGTMYASTSAESVRGGFVELSGEPGTLDLTCNNESLIATLENDRLFFIRAECVGATGAGKDRGEYIEVCRISVRAGDRGDHQPIEIVTSGAFYAHLTWKEAWAAGQHQRRAIYNCFEKLVVSVDPFFANINEMSGQIACFSDLAEIDPSKMFVDYFLAHRSGITEALRSLGKDVPGRSVEEIGKGLFFSSGYFGRRPRLKPPAHESDVATGFSLASHEVILRESKRQRWGLNRRS